MSHSKYRCAVVLQKKKETIMSIYNIQNNSTMRNKRMQRRWQQNAWPLHCGTHSKSSCSRPVRASLLPGERR